MHPSARHAVDHGVLSETEASGLDDAIAAYWDPYEAELEVPEHLIVPLARWLAWVTSKGPVQ